MRNFQRLVFVAIVGTYLVILAGAVVRGTGSGLGCPDWPRCFGQWVPPLDLSELPPNYKEVYKIAGKTIADFDPFKTWTEYVNRLLGALLGVIMVGLFAASLTVKKYEKNLPWFCGGLLFLIIIQGGVGAWVVSTHLKPFTITIHMVLALALLFGLIYLRQYCFDLQNARPYGPPHRQSLRVARLLLWLCFFQVLLGTQVRQSVDHFMRDTQVATTQTVIDYLGASFYIHRTFSLFIVGLFIYLLYTLHRAQMSRERFFHVLMAFLCVLANVVTGITLNYFDFPAKAQPPHLFFGVLVLGLLYSTILKLKGPLLGP